MSLQKHRWLGAELLLPVAARGAMKPADGAAKNRDGHSRAVTEVTAQPAGRSLRPHAS